MKTKITFLVAIIAMFFASEVFGQEVLTATKVTKSRGAADEYVVPSGDEFPMEKPALSRGGCVVKLDNWTGYYVDIWVDKAYKGRLNPWENSQLILQQGFTEVYCRTMGESYQWKSAGECNEQFVLKVDDEDSDDSDF